MKKIILLSILVSFFSCSVQTDDRGYSVKVGDNVLYGKYSGTDLKYEGKDYLIMKESDILAIIN